jgi:FkbM family methyltransferase
VRRFDMKKIISEGLLSQPIVWLLAREVLWSQRRQGEEALVPFLIRPNAVAIDVGANRGIYTKIMLTRTRNVICIEPNPDCSRVLERVFGKNVRVITGAASNRNMDVVLRIPDTGSGFATMEESNLFLSHSFKTVRVKAFRIDELRLENVSFIKIDVEGHEVSVLEGALETLEKNKPSILLEAEERHRPRAVATVREFLEPLGYEGYMLEEGSLVSIRRFNPAVHQSAGAAQQRLFKRRHIDSYINNFIFLATLSAGEPLTKCDAVVDRSVVKV